MKITPAMMDAVTRVIGQPVPLPRIREIMEKYHGRRSQELEDILSHLLRQIREYGNDPLWAGARRQAELDADETRVILAARGAR